VGTFLQNLSTLHSGIIRYVCDGQTDKQTTATLISPFPTVGGIINGEIDVTVNGTGQQLVMSSVNLVLVHVVCP